MWFYSEFYTKFVPFSWHLYYILLKLHWNTVGSPVFCERCHVCLPVFYWWCLILETVFCGWCLLCALMFCRWCLIGFHAFCWCCLVALPGCGWCLAGMLRNVEVVTLGCLANFWLHCLRNIVVVPKTRWGCQRTLWRSTSHNNPHVKIT